MMKMIEIYYKYVATINNLANEGGPGPVGRRVGCRLIEVGPSGCVGWGQSGPGHSPSLVHTGLGPKGVIHVLRNNNNKKRILSRLLSY